MAIGTGAAIIGSALVGGAIQADAAKKGADAMSDASKDANYTQMRMFNQQREDQMPWLDAGKRALIGLQDDSFNKDFTMQDFEHDPGYDFRLKEGMKAINNAASARGISTSGRTFKDIIGYNQNAASEEFSNARNRFNDNRTQRWNRLAGVANVGQTAGSQLGQAGQNFANQYGSNLMGGANAQAAGRIAQGNQINNLIGTGVNYYNQNQMMNRMENLFGSKPTDLMAGQSYTDYGNVG